MKRVIGTVKRVQYTTVGIVYEKEEDKEDIVPMLLDIASGTIEDSKWKTDTIDVVITEFEDELDSYRLKYFDTDFAHDTLAIYDAKDYKEE